MSRSLSEVADAIDELAGRVHPGLSPLGKDIMIGELHALGAQVRAIALERSDRVVDLKAAAWDRVSAALDQWIRDQIQPGDVCGIAAAQQLLVTATIDEEPSR